MTTLPDQIKTTDMGMAKITYVHSAPVATYKCPLCWYNIDLGESHHIIVPESNPQLRKHVHSDCLRAYLENKLDITLFTKQFQKVEGYAGTKR